MSSTVSGTDPSTSSGVFNASPRISLSNNVLSSVMPLPDNPLIVYSVFSPRPASVPAYQLLDNARRQLVSANKSLPILESSLPSIHLANQPALYVFSIIQQDCKEATISKLCQLEFNGLHRLETSQYNPRELYPCARPCREPCSDCLSQHMLISPTPLSSTTSVHSTLFAENTLPRIPLRQPHSHFLKAVRDRVLDDLAENSRCAPARHAVKRLRDGFLLGPLPRSSDWSVDWEHHAEQRSHDYCGLDVHLTESAILIQPLLQLTHYQSMPRNLPHSPGRPVTLLPYGTPAYFISRYSGPCSTLTLQFEQSLLGLGAGDWKSLPSTGEVSYNIVWMRVENKQGEEKGLFLVWPERLCLAFNLQADDIHARTPLSYIPTLAPQLQPSPPHPLASTKSYQQSYQPLYLAGSHSQMINRPSISKSPTRDALRAFRSLTVTKSRDVRHLAVEVGGYVDAIAKEREKERERLRLHRGASSTVMTPGGSNPSQVTTIESAMTPTPNAETDIPIPPATSVFAQTPPSEENYPSPPEMSFPGPSTSLPPSSAQLFSEFPLQESVFVDFPNRGLDFMMMGLDSISGGDMGGASAVGSSTTYAHGKVMDDDDAFTDDDFNFFDNPKIILKADSAALTDLVQSFATDNLTLSGPGPPSQIVNLTPWASLIEQTKIDDKQILPSETIPSPPFSNSVPSTPAVHLAHAQDRNTGELQLSDIVDVREAVFKPIPFANIHRTVDGKYDVGKFALPSPPDEEDRTIAMPSPSRPPFMRGPTDSSWKTRYEKATDPRIRVVSQLQVIGVKRKNLTQGAREVKPLPVWIREDEDWGVPPPIEGLLDPESEEEDIEMEEEASNSRPCTPIPPYLPLGPSLLATHFQHSELLPLSTPLRPPGSAVAPTSPGSAAAIISVPTPVSPDATGLNSEKMKALEATANIYAKEIVENPVWFATLQSTMPTAIATVGQVQAKSMASVLGLILGAKVSLDLEALFIHGADSETALLPLKSPNITLSKGGAIVQVLPTALRFWEKLALGPRGGKKNVTAFVVYEAGGQERDQQVTTWLSTLSEVYTGQLLGNHQPGPSSAGLGSGLVPIRFESFRKELGSFISNLSTETANQVVYIVTPTSSVSLRSPLLRQVFTGIKRAQKSNPQITFHLVPERIIAGSIDHPAAYNSDSRALCHSVFNRILKTIDRRMSRVLNDSGEPRRAQFQDLVFTLARPTPSKVKLAWQAQTEILDVVDRHTLLHVGYRISTCQSWLIAVCTDERGEAHDIRVWLTQAENSEVYVAGKLWELALQFARRANVEWRIVFSKLGLMTSVELSAWTQHLSIAIPSCLDLPFHVSLLAADTSKPWIPLPSDVELQNTATTSDKASPLFVDSSAMTYALFPTLRLPLVFSTPPTTDLSHIPDVTETPSHHDAPAILPLSTSTLIRVSKDLGHNSITMLHLHLLHTTKSSSSTLGLTEKEILKDVTCNFHDLAILGGLLSPRLEKPILPFHLAAVQAIEATLGPLPD